MKLRVYYYRSHPRSDHPADRRLDTIETDATPNMISEPKALALGISLATGLDPADIEVVRHVRLVEVLLLISGRGHIRTISAWAEEQAVSDPEALADWAKRQTCTRWDRGEPIRWLAQQWALADDGPAPWIEAPTADTTEAIA